MLLQPKMSLVINLGSSMITENVQKLLNKICMVCTNVRHFKIQVYTPSTTRYNRYHITKGNKCIMKPPKFRHMMNLHRTLHTCIRSLEEYLILPCYRSQFVLKLINLVTLCFISQISPLLCNKLLEAKNLSTMM